MAVLPVFRLPGCASASPPLPWRTGCGGSADEAPLDGRSRALLFLESFLGSFLFSICMLFGMREANHLGRCHHGRHPRGGGAAVPAVSARERCRCACWRQSALAVAGIVVLAFTRAGPDDTRTSALGMAPAGRAVFHEASYVVIGRRLTGKLSPRRIECADQSVRPSFW